MFHDSLDARPIGSIAVDRPTVCQIPCSGRNV
jgi:hypothetical protein